METRKRGLGSDPLSVMGVVSAKRPPKGEAPDTRSKHPKPGVSEEQILALTDRPLSGLIADFYVCNHCAFVDRGTTWETTPTCPRCGRAISNARFYFPKAVHSLIDLIQGMHHSKAKESGQGGYDHRLATALFTCRLADTLLDHLFQQIMIVIRVPARVAQQLMADNDRGRGREQTLFKTLTGDTWRQALERVNKESDLDPAETDRFRSELQQGHDGFFRRGEKWALDEETTRRCLQHVRPFLNLFVGLHNYYVSRAT